MNLENLEAFVFINHFGSINKAAKALFLSQPSVSARLQSLERELDTKLFDRSGRQLIITEKAKTFLPYAEGIVQSYKDGKKRLKEKESADQLVIGCTELASNYLLPKIIPLFHRAYPDVRIKLITDKSEVILKKLLNREVDIGFVRGSSHPLAESKEVIESPIQLFVQPNHPFAKTEKIELENLAKEPIVFFECGSLDWSMIQNLFKNLNQFPNIKYEVNQLQTAKSFILNGTGIGFLPEICVRDEVEDSQLKAIDIPILANLSLNTNVIYYKENKPAYFDSLFQFAQMEEKKFF